MSVEITEEYVAFRRKELLNKLENLLESFSDYKKDIEVTREISIVYTELEKLIAIYKYFVL